MFGPRHFGRPTIEIAAKGCCANSLSPSDEGVAGKTASGSSGDEFSGVIEESLATGATALKKNVVACTRAGVCSTAARPKL
jgi:hypothetical protein